MIANARDYNDPSRRLRQLERVLLIVELLAPLRYGATLGELTHDIRDTLDSDYCERTIRRDLLALEQMGVVEPVRTNQTRPGGGPLAPRWRWVDRSPRAAVLSRAAEVRSERRDALELESV